MIKNTLLAALLVLGSAWVVFWLSPELMNNPGPLMRGHERLAGDCFQCHLPFMGPTREKCLACHPWEKIPNPPGRPPFHQELASADCAACHSDHQGIAPQGSTTFEHDLLDPRMRSYCRQCHRKPEDATHRDVLRGCPQCHHLESWRTAVLDHRRYFRFDADHPPRCVSCHPGEDYWRYTCFGCHEHTMENIREEHEEEGIADFRRCHECHHSSEGDS